MSSEITLHSWGWWPSLTISPVTPEVSWEKHMDLSSQYKAEMGARASGRYGSSPAGTGAIGGFLGQFFPAQHLELVLTLFIFIIKQGVPSGNPKVGSVMPEQFWSISEVNLQESFVLFGPSKVSWMKYVSLVQLMLRCWAAGVYARRVKEERKIPLWSFSCVNYASRYQAGCVMGVGIQEELGLGGMRKV